MPEDKSENKNIAEMRDRLAKLESENREMQGVIREIAHANVLPNVLQCGFSELIAELKPLRDLTPKRESVPENIAKAASAMLKAMNPVALSGGSLGIVEVNVRFIGQPPLPLRGAGGYSGAAQLPLVGQADPNQALLPNQ